VFSDNKSSLPYRPVEAAVQYLRFVLIPEVQVMLPLSQLSEVLTLTLAQIVPIPSLPSWVVGIYNWRGEILWIVDLGELVGLTPWHQYASTTLNYRVIILRNDIRTDLGSPSGTSLHQWAGSEKSEKSKGENIFLGLLVPQVEDMEWCSPDEIYSPPATAIVPGMTPFLRGYWLKANGTMVMVLNGEAILAAMPA